MIAFQNVPHFADALTRVADAAHGAEAGAHDASLLANPTLWVGVAFAGIVILTYRKIARAVANALDVRAEKIRGKLDEARQLRDDAQALLAEYQRKQKDAMREAEDIIAHAKIEAEREKVRAAAALEDSIKRRERQAMDRIAQAETAALAEVRALAAELAVAAATKVIADSLSAAKSNAMIDQAIDELPEKLN